MTKRTWLCCRLALQFAAAGVSREVIAADRTALPVAAGAPVSEFLTPGGRFDLEAARRSGYEGPLDLSGFGSSLDPATMEPVFQPAAVKNAASVLDDVYWESVFDPAGPDNFVSALAVFDSQLIAGGDFTDVAGTTADYIAAFDGRAWSALGSGMNGSVEDLAVFDSQLIAVGTFTTAGGATADHVAAWNGANAGRRQRACPRSRSCYLPNLILGSITAYRMSIAKLMTTKATV